MGMNTPQPVYPTTAAEYKEWVKQLSSVSPRETLFTGDCKRLAKFLQDADMAGTERHHASRFHRVYLLDNPIVNGDSRMLEGHTGSVERGNRILFLSGYPSARALAEIGSKYQISPEFFDRHLSFVGDDATSCRIHPSHYVLPSRQQLVLQLSIPSVGGVHGEWPHEDLHQTHQANAEGMNVYMHELRMGKGWKPFSSIVRSTEIHDFCRFSIEQFVTVHISPNKTGFDDWTVAIWSDSGADLSNSPTGPWLASATHAHFRPVTLTGPDLGLRCVRPLDDPGAVIPGRLPQSLSLLRNAYGRSLDRSEMAKNPIYALDELFRFYVASELQYLDMIASVLETSASEDDRPSQSNGRTILLHSRRMLQRRQSHIAGLLDFLRFPTVAGYANASARTRSAMDSLYRDLEYLQANNQELVARCHHKLSIITSDAMFEDARRGIVLSRNSQKFAAFAAFYIPLSFTCSIFGMNFVEIDAMGRGWQLWVMVSLPVFLISLAILLWNPEYVLGVWLETRGWVRRRWKARYKI